MQVDSVTHAPVFPVKKIQIQGQMKRVTPEQLRFIAEHELTGTFFTLDIDKTGRRLASCPGCGTPSAPALAGCLEIAVEEHVAQARWGENGLVDSHGDRFDAASDQQLPVFHGPAGAEKDMTAMLARLRQGPETDGAGSQKSGCRRVGPGKWTWTTASSWTWAGATWICGWSDLPCTGKTTGSAAVPHRLRDMRYPNGFAGCLITRLHRHK
jgi:hypothetical protein